MRTASHYKIEWVKISPETDGVDGLYINGKLVTQGDYYHDKISDYIAGFLAGLKRSEERRVGKEC